MVSPPAQAKITDANERWALAVRMAVIEVDKAVLRKIAQKTISCSLRCYDTAGQVSSDNALQQCTRTCNKPHLQANALLRQVNDVYMGQLCVFKFGLTSSTSFAVPNLRRFFTFVTTKLIIIGI